MCQKIEKKERERDKFSNSIYEDSDSTGLHWGPKMHVFPKLYRWFWWWAKIWTSTGVFHSFYNRHLVSACDEPGTLFFIIHNNPVKFLWYRKDEWLVQGPRVSKFRRQGANQVLVDSKACFLYSSIHLPSHSFKNIFLVIRSSSVSQVDSRMVSENLAEVGNMKQSLWID